MDPEICYPWEVKPLTQDELDEYKKHNIYQEKSQIRVGPKGYLLLSGFLKEGPKIYAMEIRPSDVFVLSQPCLGTAWTMELVWMIGNDHDYKKASEKILSERFPYLEKAIYPNIFIRSSNNCLGGCKCAQGICVASSVTDSLADAPSPRFIKSHLPLSLLPPTLLETAKVVYVVRDPRDLVVSQYHFYKSLTTIDFRINFKTFWNFFIENNVTYGPCFPHIMEAWEKRNHPNMLILFYEELFKDMPAVIRRVAHFLEKAITEEQVRRLCDHLNMDNFRLNNLVNHDYLKENGIMDANDSSITKGKEGGWREYFDEEMTVQAERWIEDNLRGTNLLSFQQKL